MNVIQLEPKGMFCLGWLEDLFSGPEFKHHSDFPYNEGAFVLIPAEYWADRVEELNDRLNRLTWSVVILASDERGLFPVEELSRDIDSLWVMTPHFESHVYPEGTNFMGEFFPSDARRLIATSHRDRADQRKYTVGFSGQITHQRRDELVEAMSNYSDHYYLNRTAGFTQGLGREDYYQLMADCQAVPAPSGPVTLDSFRAFEALEAGAVPILDLVCPVEQDGHLYWNSILGVNHPIPSVYHWNQVHEWGHEIDDRWPEISNTVFSWWQLHKREMRHRILSSSPIWVDNDRITILMPTSPVPSNPSLEKITQTVESVRRHLPTADILILCDGVRPEQEERRSDYETFVSDLLWKANFEWTNVFPIVSPHFEHQANTTRRGLRYVTTDLVLYVEHDIPFVLDLAIDFDGVARLLDSNDLDVVRFAFENQIHPDWEYLMLDPRPVDLHGVRIRRTRQWSQRNHVARTQFYREMIDEYFPTTSRTMIEDKIYGAAKHDPGRFRMAFYHPEGPIVRCFHSDGRENDTKFEMEFE